MTDHVVMNFGMPMGGIDYSFGQFTACALGGDAKLMEDGWAFWFTSGVPCSYYTRGLESVAKAVARGYSLTDAAAAALATHKDEPEWSAQKEVERKAKNASDDAERKAHYEQRQLLVESARAKLTEDEFEAVIEEGRDP